MFLGSYSNYLTSYSYKTNLRTIVYTASFIFAKSWKQSSCPWIDKGTNKFWHIHTREQYSVMKRISYQVIKIHGAIFKCILLSVRSQSEKFRQNYGDRKMFSGSQGFGGIRRGGWIGGAGDVWGSETILYGNAMVERCHYKFVKKHRLYNTKR